MGHEEVKAYIRAVQKKRALSAELKLAEQQLAELKAQAIQFMTDEGLKNQRYDEGLVYLARKVSPRLRDGYCYRDVAAVLNELGGDYPSMITVNHMSFGGMVRELHKGYVLEHPDEITDVSKFLPEQLAKLVDVEVEVDIGVRK